MERLLQRQQRSDEAYFLVNWRGYSLDESTWEPETILLEDVPEQVAAWYAAAGQPPPMRH